MMFLSLDKIRKHMPIDFINEKQIFLRTHAVGPVVQNPRAFMSTLASSVTLTVLLNDSPVSCCKFGSTQTSWKTYFKSAAVMFGTWLCLRETNPPFLQEKACWMLNVDPHSQRVGMRVNSQPYLIRTRSQNNLVIP